MDNKWVEDISGSLPADVIMEFLIIWDLTQNFQLQPGIPDACRWLPTASGEYSANSAYHRFMAGSVAFEPTERIWNSWAPSRCKLFIWLTPLNRCWTADRLARRGLNHPEKCLLCDQQEETANTSWSLVSSLEAYGGRSWIGCSCNICHLEWMKLCSKSGVWLNVRCQHPIGRVSIPWSFWWHGGSGSIETLVFSMVHLLVPPLSSNIFRRMSDFGAWLVLRPLQGQSLSRCFFLCFLPRSLFFSSVFFVFVVFLVFCNLFWSSLDLLFLI